MKISELEAQIKTVEVAQKILANTWKRLKKAKEKIEVNAQKNEGEISEVRLKEMLSAAKAFMKEDEDSIIVFKGSSQCSLEKKIIGKERCSIDNFL